VAVSGGLDSMVLLHLLHRLSQKYRWRLTVVHFNHQLRGRASGADERLVRRTAKQLGLPCVVGRQDVRGLARQQKLSLEMAARQLRHEFLARTARERGIRTVALAHHADDQVELFFLRLLRGAGAEGLSGMKWRSPSPNEQGITLVRPLLRQPKAALAAFAHKAGIRFREDASNASLDIQRNRIRHELIPLLTARYQPALADVLLRQIEVLGAESDLMNRLVESWLQKELPVAFAKLPAALQRRILHQQIYCLGFAADYVLVEQLREAPDRLIAVGSGTVLARDMDGRVRPERVEATPFQKGKAQVELEGPEGEIEFGSLRIRWQRFKPVSRSRPKRRPRCEWFTAGKVGSPIWLRHWQPGDCFQPIGMKGTVKLQDWFTNLKIPRAERRRRVVATTAQGEIWWVEGVRISERFKLAADTSPRLQWRWCRKG